MPDVPMSGAGVTSDKLASAVEERNDGVARSEMRHLRTIISELEPKLRDALKDAQMASRRERTAVSQLDQAKQAMVGWYSLNPGLHSRLRSLLSALLS
jgi:hypothetical protein